MKQANIDRAIVILNDAFSAKHLEPLCIEQVDCLYEECWAFDMIDDFEARLGLSDSLCAEVRELLVDSFAV